MMEPVRNFYKEKRGSLPDVWEAWKYFEDEVVELDEAIDSNHVAKEAADVLFTLVGYCLTMGIDLDKAFQLVCESNMTKEFTPEGKIQKGSNYVEPDMSSAIR